MDRRHRATESVTDDCQTIIEVSMNERSLGVEEASGDALMDDVEHGADAMPLLGLEPTGAENTGQNAVQIEDSNPADCYVPLLGTISPQIAVNAGKSSSKRSPKRVCYGELLRERDPSSYPTSQKTGVSGSRD